MGFFNEYPYRNITDLNLDYILNTMKRLSSEVASVLEEWNEHKADYANTVHRLEVVENEIATFESEVNAAFDAYAARLSAETDAKIDAIDRKTTAAITELTVEMRGAISSLRADVARQINSMYYAMEHNNELIFARVANELQEFLDNLPDYSTLMVFNPVRGYRTSIQSAINDLYSYALVNAITAIEFDNLVITAQDFDDLALTPHEFDRNGRDLLGVKDPKLYMYDPWTGKYVLIKSVVEKLVVLHQNGIKAVDFDALSITADDFDNMLIDAYNFDWDGATIFN